jgi:hypothetical protein
MKKVKRYGNVIYNKIHYIYDNADLANKDFWIRYFEDLTWEIEVQEPKQSQVYIEYITGLVNLALQEEKYEFLEITYSVIKEKPTV